MRKMNKSAFTLVELIVVITILAILATVAFISLGGQTQNARNTVKKDSIGKLATAVENARTTGVSIASFAANNNSALTAGNIAGVLVTSVPTKVGAGDINLSALSVKADDFKDGNNQYKYGYSKFNGGKFEVAGSLKEGELDTAYLVGNYENRTTAGSTASGAISSTNDKQFELSDDSQIKRITIGDTVTTDGSNTFTVSAVSDDFKTITLNATIPATADHLALANDETAGLIESTTAGTPVTNGSQNVPYAN